MEDPIVQIKNGLIRGVIEKHEEGFSYYAFKGIPYAEPPIDELRFEDPVPKEDWKGVIDCKNYSPVCLQYDYCAHVTSYNEDCLHLNVFTRSINEPSVNIPVMMVIHGGGYVFGGSSDFVHGPEYLIRKNIVLVLINYRLGILGFLDLEDEVASGNQGFKDQVMALQWIQQNIRMFGGDPDNVTVLDTTSGGSAAHALAISPLSKGLVHKLIAQGTTLYNSWTYVKNPRAKAIMFCSLLGKKLTEPKEIKNFLKTVDAKMLQETQELLRKTIATLPFGPGIDGKSPRPFMPVDRETMAGQAVHIPCLVGFNTRETIILVAGTPMKEALALIDRNFEKILAYNGEDIMHRYDVTEMQTRRLYYGNEAITEKNLDKFVDLTTDLYFTEGIHRFARVQAERSSASTYLYRFDYESPYSLVRITYGNLPKGPSHFDDLPFLFKMRILEKAGLEYFQKGTSPYLMMEQLTEMWTNFAKYGKPTLETTELIPVHWKPITDGTVLRYLNIDEDITMQSTINIDQKILSARDITV